MEPRRIFFLTGAPTSRDVEGDNDLLQDNFSPSIEAFLGGHGVILNGNCQDDDHALTPNWRSVPSSPRPGLPTFSSSPSYDLRLGNVQRDFLPERIDLRAMSFESRSFSAYYESASDVSMSIAQSQFLQHSLAFHERLEFSQLEAYDSQQDSVALSFSATSFQNILGNDSRAPVRIETLAIAGSNSQASVRLPFNLTITSLGAIPSAEYLDLIYPQTLTSNLVVIVTSRSPPRSVITRSKRLMLLYDVQVADETGSDFKVTFWLPPHPSAKEENVTIPRQQTQLRIALDCGRSGDIVLLQNIAMSHFRGAVHGQSLHPHVLRPQTALYVITRGGVDQLPTPQLGPDLRPKIERVKTWAKRFFSRDIAPRSGMEVEQGRKRKGLTECNVSRLPLDKQP